MTDSNYENLRRQLEVLKKENQYLKTRNSEDDSDCLTVTEGEYNGYPTLTFKRGNKKPFNVGLKKLIAVIEAREKVEIFLKKHNVTALKKKPKFR